MKALIVENDPQMAQKLIDGLRRNGVEAVHAPDGWQIVNALGDVDVVVLNIRHRDPESLSLCRVVRAMSQVPIVVGTADRELAGSVSEIDDCLLMPYKISDLAERLRAATQRQRGSEENPVIRQGDVEIDLVSQTATVAGRRVDLARKEFQILALVAAERGGVCTRERLIAEIWGTPWPGVQDTLNVHVATLRARLRRPDLIKTVRGTGYRLNCTQAPPVPCSAR
ncbi:response regulator transcription factor [Pseudonocardia eucalypti]|uniref:Response regulator transcription factor n=1 Tax=Pseudonocardia eucalypti TaxID=648755 RepID=A0ABP9QCD8_9PSEU|nr:DNA-binding response OmpR family regulator [Pseudonocardia eucalypti]